MGRDSLLFANFKYNCNAHSNAFRTSPQQSAAASAEDSSASELTKSRSLVETSSLWPPPPPLQPRLLTAVDQSGLMKIEDGFSLTKFGRFSKDYNFRMNNSI